MSLLTTSAAKLRKYNELKFMFYASIVSFSTYFCMYAYRKPFSVGKYVDALPLLGLAYKDILIIAQVMGYMFSKFIGIKVVSELKPQYRILALLLLIGISETALIGFGMVSQPWHVPMLFLNGMPLGMIWGIVFSFLEGRRTTEILGAALSSSFILASGAVKSVGQLVINQGISEYWMPATVGGIFAIPLLVSVYFLSKTPPPTDDDKAQRTERAPMTGAERIVFTQKFFFGIVLMVAAYMLMTAYRDYRDNFAAELWAALGFEGVASIFTLSEIPIAVIVLVTLGATIVIRNNMKAFLLYHFIIAGGMVLIGVSTLLFQAQLISPIVWMVLGGLGLYMGYVPFNYVLFDRLIAAFRYTANAGFMIYVADAFGYLGSVGILVYKNFGQANLNWLDFFIASSYVVSIVGALLMLAAWGYYFRKQKKEMLQ